MGPRGLLLGVLGLLALGSAGAGEGPLPEDATQEHGYYLQQLFGQSSTRSWATATSATSTCWRCRRRSTGTGTLSGSTAGTRHPPPRRPPAPPARGPPSQKAGRRQRPPSPRCRGHPWEPWGPPRPRRDQPGLSLLGRVLGLEHSGTDHPHDDCLNVTQLLVNFGLDSVSQLTPEQFTLLCPALLYQIDSRVCIQHSDEVTLPPPGGALWPALGWGLLAVAFVSLPSALAVILLPLLSRSCFRSLLAFLVALAVGTLCGDALLHLWPHAQGMHQETPGAEVLQGLAVLGGIYLLFLVELLLGMLRRSREARGRSPGETPDVAVGVLAPSQGGAELRHLTAPEPELELKPYGCSPHSHSPHDHSPHGHSPHGHSSHGHSHGPALPASPGAADVVWMVVLGDGIHNLTDGLAIGAAFSHSLASGLSTALAVLCHELPHELGDLAVLLRAGTAPRTVLLLNLLSALLSCLGAAAGAAVGQSASHLTPWLLTATAGVFLYVALADMLPEALRGTEGPGEGGWGRFLLQNAGFLLGGGIMLGIALAEGHVRAWLQP
ncbi:LOW QUALITY PROTEIN: zinc transporter ZIP5 [Pelecanus crispus]|uniref:LOW QUALITY PROTEIN: zinc transporter ZIP5 n=1 Tax=Pelecanus crispus TaxID=36300 RepID=UPI003F5D44C7